MRGRHFSILVFLSVGQLILFFSDVKLNRVIRNYSVLLVLFTVIAASFVEFRFPFISSVEYIGKQREAVEGEIGIQDERGFFYTRYGLLSPVRVWPEISLTTEPPEEFVITCGFLGVKSLDWKNLHIIDNCGLTDPLISKLPAIRDNKWRIGHNIRNFPTDYGEFVIGKVSTIPDIELRDIAKDIQILTKGKLYTIERFKAIWRMNTGYYSSRNLEKYSNPSTYFPRSTTYKEIYVKNWEERVPRVTHANLAIYSENSFLANRVQFKVNASRIFEILVNEEIVATNQFTNDPHDLLSIQFSHPILVNSVKIRTIGLRTQVFKKWWQWPIYYDWLELLSLE